VIERMHHAESADAAAMEGVAIAREVGRALKPLVQGVHVSAPPRRDPLKSFLVDCSPQAL
jgi:hypothetical protein